MTCKHKKMLFYGTMPNGPSGPVSMWRCPKCGVLSTHPDGPWVDDYIANLYLLIESASLHRARLQRQLTWINYENLVLWLALLAISLLVAHAWGVQ